MLLAWAQLHAPMLALKKMVHRFKMLYLWIYCKNYLQAFNPARILFTNVSTRWQQCSSSLPQRCPSTSTLITLNIWWLWWMLRSCRWSHVASRGERRRKSTYGLSKPPSTEMGAVTTCWQYGTTITCLSQRREGLGPLTNCDITVPLSLLLPPSGDIR